MTAVVPVKTTTTAGYVNPQRGFQSGVASITENLITTGAQSMGRENLQLSIFFFDVVGAGDTWASGIPGVRAVAWQGADATDDAAGVCLSTQESSTTPFGAIITIDAQSSSSEGWLWVLHAS